MAGEIFIADKGTLDTVNTKVTETNVKLGDTNSLVSGVSNKIGAKGDTGSATVFGKLTGLDNLIGGRVEFRKPGTYTFKVPNGVDTIAVTAAGGGGGGQSSVDSKAWGRQGNIGGATGYKQRFTVVPGTVMTIKVGAGGVGGVKGGDGTAGGNTIIGNIVTAPGGGAGTSTSIWQGKQVMFELNVYPEQRLILKGYGTYGEGGKYPEGDVIYPGDPGGSGYALIEWGFGI